MNIFVQRELEPRFKWSRPVEGMVGLSEGSEKLSFKQTKYEDHRGND